MKKLRILLMLAGLAVLISPLACSQYTVTVITPSPSSVDEAGLYHQMANITLLVIGESGTGSGVAIEDGRKVLTAAHVVSRREPVYDEDGNPLFDEDGYILTKTVIEHVGVMKGSFLTDASVVKFDEDLDLAVLELSTPWTHGARFTDRVTLFQKCWTSGHPLGVTDTTIIEGRIQSLFDHGFIRYSALSVFGNSGGPVFVLDKDGYPAFFSICQRVYVNADAVTHMGLGVLPEAMVKFLGDKN